MSPGNQADASVSRWLRGALPDTSACWRRQDLRVQTRGGNHLSLIPMDVEMGKRLPPRKKGIEKLTKVLLTSTFMVLMLGCWGVVTGGASLIPRQNSTGDAAAATSGRRRTSAPRTTSSTLVDINSANKEELKALPGIGDV